jgi:hypothetical protein
MHFNGSHEVICDTIKACLQSTYFRQPTCDEIHKNMKINANIEFINMFGNIDYMHWVWKNRLMVCDRVNSKTRMEIVESFLKLLLINHYGFGISSSTCLKVAMISMS